MAKNKTGAENKSGNTQKKLNDAATSIPGDNMNQNHNSKKTGLGPNTKR